MALLLEELLEAELVLGSAQEARLILGDLTARVENGEDLCARRVSVTCLAVKGGRE